MNEPIADAVRSILDGHIILSRQLATRNHYPCIDVLHSASRLFSQLTTGEHRAAAARFRELLATYNNAEDLIKIGAYQHGSSPIVDEAIQRHDQFNVYLRQDRTRKVDQSRAIEELMSAVAVEGRR